MTTPRQPMPEPFRPFYILPGTRVGAYVVRDVIGQGGGQTAYLANASDGRKVVLKVSRFSKGKKGSRDREMYGRFIRQVTFFLSLSDVPGVAQIFASGMYPDSSESSSAYMVQEWVPGSVNILDWARKTPHSLKTVVNAWMTLAEACGVMARRRICNRDLKPENILVTPRGVPKIVDFDSGMADGETPLTTHGAGGWPATKRYHTPEMCHVILADWERWGRTRTPFDYRPSGDLHALGVVFYQVLTGEYPFDEGEDDEELLQHIAFQVPQRPSALNPEVPFGLDKVAMKLLEKAPQLRYHSGDALAADLKALLSTSGPWRRRFQTPARKRHSSSSRSQASGTLKKAVSMHTSRTAEGSAALNLAPSAIVLAGPRALAVRGPRRLLRLEPVPAAADPELRWRVLCRRALLLVAALALAFVVPWLSLRQHEAAGSPFERATMLIGKMTKTVVMAASSAMALTACVGPTEGVRVSREDWLAKCPPESRKAINELEIEPDRGDAEVLPGPNAIIGPFENGLEVRDGPVEISASLPAAGGGQIARLFGVIKTGPDGASLHFTRMKLFVGDEPDDAPPAGREYAVCAYVNPRGYAKQDLIPMASAPPPESERHPGFTPVLTQRLWIHFAH